MKRISLKQLFLGGVVVTVAAFSVIGTSSIPQYKTTTLLTDTVRKEIDFTTNWYPVGYAKVSLGAAQDIRKIYVKEGDSISKDKVLAQLNDETEYNQYKATLSTYYAAIKAKKNAAATPMTPQATLDTLQGQINTTYYQMKNTEVALNKKKIKAPISGKVMSVSVTDYSTATAASALSAVSAAPAGNFIVIANNKDASLTATVSEKDRAKLTVDMKVTLTSRTSDKDLVGKVSKIASSPVVVGVEDPSYQITIKLDEYPAEPIGTKLEGSIIIFDKTNVSAIQYDALTIDSSTNGTVLVLKDNQVASVVVGVGAVGDDLVEITSGLTKDDQIVVDQLADKKIVTFRPWLKKLLKLN